MNQCLKQIFLINQENKAIIKSTNLLKSLSIRIDFNVTFRKFCGVTPSEPTQKINFRPINGRFAPILLRHSDIPPPPHQTFLDPPLASTYA